MGIFKKFMARLRSVIPNPKYPPLLEPAPAPTIVDNICRIDGTPYRLPPREVDRYWDKMQETREKIMRGRVLIVSYQHRMHEVLNQDLETKTRHGLLRCGKGFTVPMQNMCLAYPGAVTCSDCLQKRAQLN